MSKIDSNVYYDTLNIEYRYPVEDIEYKGIKIWPFIRHDLYKQHVYGNATSNSFFVKTSLLSKTISVLQAITLTSYNLFFRKRNIIIFGNYSKGGCERFLDGIYVDRFFNEILKQEKNVLPLLFYNKSVSIHINSYKKYIHLGIFKLFVQLFLCFNQLDTKRVRNYNLLRDIINELNIKFNIDKMIMIISSYIVIFRIFFRFIEPEKIYFTCYYEPLKMVASFVAKEMKIPVIELQHGTIFNKFDPYVPGKNIHPNPYPNYLFSFGEIYSNFISQNIYKKEHIFPIGSYYIELIKSKKEYNQQLFFKKYNDLKNKIIITVASQMDIDNKLLSMIKSLAQLRSDVVYIYKPREITVEHSSFSCKNIFIENTLDVYQCMQNSHITTAVSSTCAIESLVFGTPVILLNINNLAKFWYSEMFSSVNSVLFTDTLEEYLSAIPEAMKMDREKVTIEGNLFYADNHKERVKIAIKKINELSKNKL